jgi:hypothetical protein
VSAAAGLTCLFAPGEVAPATAAAPPPGAVLALAERGLGGDFEATYQVRGQLAIFPGPRWTIIVAHEGQAPASEPFRPDGAIWSFFMHAGKGYELQWIEDGQHFEDCWTTRTRPGWHFGQGTYEPSNGSSMATLPYVPATAFTDLAHAAQGGPARRHLSVARRDNTVFGPLTCLTSVSTATAALAPGTSRTVHPFITTCLTARGLVANQDGWGEGAWDDLALVHLRSQAQASDFRPVSAIGPLSTLPPL